MSALDAEIDALADTPPATEPVTPGWKTDTAGRQFINKPSGRGMIYRRGEETIDEALQRDAQGPDPKPPKRKKPKKPPPPKGVDLQALEETIAEALKSPASIAGMFGDEWLVDHFIDKGPLLARNLVKASETNPWLRRKLEEIATGGDMAVQFLTVLSLAGAVVMYAAPPVLYLTNARLSPQARFMLGVPERRRPEPPAPPPATYNFAPPPTEQMPDAAPPESPDEPIPSPLDELE